MKLYPLIFFIIILVSLFLFNGSGCTNIDNPVREEALEKLSVSADKYEVLDTESVKLEAKGGIGLVKWVTVPAFKGVFSPETGPKVLFIPPDVTQETAVTIVSSDETGRSVQIIIYVQDEGPPPERGDILINEIAWAGTLTSAYDEYIELVNKSARPFYLSGWKIENAAGSGSPLSFSSRIEATSTFIIANYDEGSEKTALTVAIDYSDSALSIPNSSFEPFVLKNQTGEIFDKVGDGSSYMYGLTGEIKSSLSRYTDSTTTEWDPGSWYTEGLSINLRDGTLGTPGAINSDIPYETGPSEDDALAVITEFFIDANNELIEDWIELYITKSGNIKNFIVTDLDGTDLPITEGADRYVAIGDYILVIWSTSYMQDESQYYIPDSNPTGTKDELVLLCGDVFLDGLCYCSGDIMFDDEDKIRGSGWTGDPVIFTDQKHASKKLDGDGEYCNAMQAESWDTYAEPTPGLEN
jgi:hypothetical protein